MIDTTMPSGKTIFQSSLAAPGNEDKWLVDTLTELDFLELLELGGDCGRVLRRLRHRMARGAMRLSVQTLIVHGGGYAKSQAFKLESVKGNLGLQDMAVTYNQDPDAENSRDDETRDDDLGSSSDGSGEDDGSDLRRGQLFGWGQKFGREQQFG